MWNGTEARPGTGDHELVNLTRNKAKKRKIDDSSTIGPRNDRGRHIIDGRWTEGIERDAT